MVMRSTTNLPLSTRVILHAGESAKTQDVRETPEQMIQAVAAGQQRVNTQDRVNCA
jgi:hypothetical protein